MRVGVYNGLASNDFGGSERCLAVLAEALLRSHEVEFVHHFSSLTVDRLAKFTGTDLSRMSLRTVEAEPSPLEKGYPSPNPWRRYQEAQDWYATLSRPYDLFINFTHYPPPICHAPRGVLRILFPWTPRPDTAADLEAIAPSGSSLKRRLRRYYNTWYYNWEWNRRMKGYQLKAANSGFSKIWTKRRWGVDCDVVYPPVDVGFQPTAKENFILSVGRFSACGYMKKQIEMLTAYGQLNEARKRGWEYYCVGGLGDFPDDRAYFERARHLGDEVRAHVLPNLERARLLNLYEQSKVFWHAAGHGEDASNCPELSEHFGIATVEAMAAGCVPVVVNRGGQPEIVQHGVNGFVWDTLDDLREYTVLLMRDEALRTRLADAARSRAQHFSQESYVRRFLDLLRPLLS